MQVAVQHTCVEKHGEAGVDGHAAQPGHVRRVRHVKTGALHPIGHEDVVAHQIVHHGGRAHGAQSVDVHGLSKLARVVCLQSVVSLGHKAAAPLVHERKRRVDVGLVCLNAVDLVL